MALRIFAVFLGLGLTSFGGPVAHLAYFREVFVVRRRWLSEAAYAERVALAQFLPGPASSQVGLAIGLARGGYAGALAAWLGFTLPSAIAMLVFASLVTQWGDAGAASTLQGLKLVAVAVVAQALWGMGRTLCPDRPRLTIAAMSAVTVVLLPTAMTQLGVVVLAGITGVVVLRAEMPPVATAWPTRVGRRVGLILLGLFLALLLSAPLFPRWFGDGGGLFAGFFRVGALVFGGGHVVLPLLQAEVVNSDHVSGDAFLAGYGAAQALPGPLFSFAAYLGALSTAGPGGVVGGLIALVAVFLPGALLMLAVLPLWDDLRRYRTAHAALQGVNAAVVGLLLAAFYDPVWNEAIHHPGDFAFAVLALLLLAQWRLPPWLVVAAGGALYGGVMPMLVPSG